MLRRLVAVLVLPVLLAGCCCYGGLLTSRRVDRTSARSVDVSGVDTVELRTSGSLVIRQGELEHLEIVAPPAALDALTAEVRGGKLVLGTRPQRKPWSWGVEGPIRYELTVESLGGIVVKGSGDVDAEVLSGAGLSVRVDGSGDVRVRELQGGTLAVDIRGSGSVELAGEVGQQSATISGSGDYDGRRLASAHAIVDISGSGTATVWVAETLTVDVTGSGDCEYYGNPRVKSRETGSGDVVSLGAR